MKRLVLHAVADLCFVCLAVLAAVQMIGRVRTVDVLLLFASGFGAGVTTVGWIVRHRAASSRGSPGS